MLIVWRGYGLLAVIAGVLVGIGSQAMLQSVGGANAAWPRLLAGVVATAAMIGMDVQLSKKGGTHDVFWLPISLWALAVGWLVARG